MLPASAQTSEPDDPIDSVHRLSDLAWQYLEVGDYAQAESLFIKAMEIEKKVLGEKHPDYAVSLNSLALLYLAVGGLCQGRTALYQGYGD